MKKEWDGKKVSFELEKNLYSMEMPGFKLDNARVKVRTATVEYSDFNWQTDEDSEKSFSLTAEFPLGKLRCEFSAAKNAIQLQLSADIKEDIDELTLTPFYIDEMACDHALVHGRKMGGCKLHKLPLRKEEEFESYFQTMLTADDYTLQIAAPLLQLHPLKTGGVIRGGKIFSLSTESLVQPCPAGRMSTPPVSFASTQNPHRLMSVWAEENVEKKKTFAPLKRGWNSWDYYRWTVTEDEALENAEFIASDPVLSKHIKRIIVDDGWQYCYGEWDANPLFPSGMKKFAEKISAMGFEPGIWIAPTIIEPHCRIAQVESDMLALGKSGQPCLAYECMRRFGFVLDPTLEKAQKWLYDLFARYADYGYKYFKLDFLAQTLKAPLFHDRSVPKGQIMRKIVEPIHNAVKGRADILGCNYTFEGGTEFVEGVRTSGDIHANWGHVKNNVASIAARFWSNRTLWLNDPDFAVCRGRETANDPDMEKLKPGLVYIAPEDPKSANTERLGRCMENITFEEAKTLLSLVIISGGAVNLSDKLTRLNEKGLDLVRKTVAAPLGKAALPLDLFSSQYPAYWLQEVDCRQRRVLLINWEDCPRELMLDLTPHGINATVASDFWTGEDFKLSGNKISAELKPHHCLLLNIN